MTTRIRVVRLDEYGDVAVLEVRDVGIPEAASDHVVVQVVATSINPGEASIREGAMDSERTAAFPTGEGSDLAGRIVDVAVTGWDVGAEVKAMPVSIVVAEEDSSTGVPSDGLDPQNSGVARRSCGRRALGSRPGHELTEVSSNLLMA